MWRGLVVGVEAASDRDRARAAALLRRQRPALQRVARRVSLCRDDAEEAVQRASLILLTKAGPIADERLAAWMTVVTRREALAVRRNRERLLWAPGPAAGERADPLEVVPCVRPGPAEAALRAAAVAEAKAALAALKPHERLAIGLQAGGYSYAEICELCGWTFTNLNVPLRQGIPIPPLQVQLTT